MKSLKMKKSITAAMMIFAMITAPVMAQDFDNQAFAAKVFHIEADQSMQFAELSEQEMREYAKRGKAPFQINEACPK